ncbi:signal peptide protein [Microbacterium mangrovi]|uniref:Signal peptide protein n=1 Tax=Microbacterium mangrovi TaxID=1348253 RepID=A0A0B2A7V6_9MICO|nr:signal peptide protein [Microbacterium mangrovi]
MSTPDSLSTPFGDLEFFDGVPRAESVETIFDGLDLLRGIDAFLTAVPGASLVAMRRGLRTAGVVSPDIIGYTDPRANSGGLFLTPNTETTYGTTFLDLRAWGPTVIEAPPESLCVVDDFWFRYVADMGIPGPDKGAGGKYLFLPPGYDGERPDGYYTYECPTFTNWVVLRALGGVPAMKQTRIYPLSAADDPRENTFVNIANVLQNTVHANDFSFFEEVAQLVAEEPVTALDPERAGTLAAIGLKHGTRFAPDDRLRGILDDAARIGAAMSRAILYTPREPEAYFWEGLSWKNPFVGGSYEFLSDGARNLDARTRFHYFATVITPAMAHAQVGAGSAYTYTAHDADGHVLDGSATYSLRIPANPPAKNFWSVDLYDTQTRSLLQSTAYPALSSLTGTVQPDDDGSSVLWFAPTAPEGKESNWVPTIPGKSWFPMVRLYGPLEPWFDGTWQLPEIVKES